MNLKKWGIGCLGTIVLLIVIAFIGVKLVSEDQPTLERQAEADILANDVLSAINKPAWDSLGYISWTFTDRHHYAWDKAKEHAIISWDDHSVLLNLKNIDQYSALSNGKPISGDDARAKRDEAWSIWCNDSFWLYAPYKLFDPGTERGLVTTEDGREALLVQYTSGGVTPGDSYLWHLDENKVPNAYQMWVSIIPIGGLKASWENWTTVDGGAMIAQDHMIASMNVAITNLKTGQSPQDIGRSIADFRL